MDIIAEYEQLTFWSWSGRERKKIRTVSW